MNFSTDFPRTLYRMLLAFTASAYVIAVFLIKESVYFACLPFYVSYCLYIIAPVLITRICIALARFLPQEGIEVSVKAIEPASYEFLPSFLGYFFVALSVPNYTTLVFVYMIIFGLTYLSQSLYFNPLLLVFGFKFFRITMSDDTRILLITRSNLKNPNDVDIETIHRINDFSFINLDK